VVAAGARIDSLEMAAAAGDITGWPLARFTLESRLRALVFAADHQRLDVIDQLVRAGTPVSATPGTTAPRWRNASQPTALDTARSRLSSGP
jgi:hypothetical protein